MVGCWFVGEFDLPLGTDIDIVGVAWSVRDVLPPTQHGYRECWRGWFVVLNFNAGAPVLGSTFARISRGQ